MTKEELKKINVTIQMDPITVNVGADLDDFLLDEVLEELEERGDAMLVSVLEDFYDRVWAEDVVDGDYRISFSGLPDLN